MNALHPLIAATLPFMLFACSETDSANTRENAGLLTLYAHDWLRNTCDLSAGGRYGHIEKGGRLYNQRSILGFHRWLANGFTVPCQGGVVGDIVDVGPLHDPETGAAGFFSLIKTGEQLAFRPGGYQLELSETLRNWPKTRINSSPRSLPIHVGHNYVIRHRDRQVTASLGPTQSRTRYFKMLVVDFVPGSHVSIRWGEL